MRWAFLGPSGTFTEEALMSIAQDGIERIACASIEEVFAAVEAGTVDHGIVPIENSVEGAVNATLDALAFGREATISRETVIDIHHALIVAPGVELDEVTAVASHPHATAQCRNWLAENLPGRPVLAANSTADAVQRAVRERGVAAVGTRLAAHLHDGVVLREAIEDYADNKTRFVVIDRENPEPTGDDKTTLALFLHTDKPGALLMILSEFAYGEINLTKIQSRPTKQALGEYMFFVDLEGHSTDPRVSLALDCLRLKLREVKVLGSYPRYRGSSRKT